MKKLGPVNIHASAQAKTVGCENRSVVYTEAHEQRKRSKLLFAASDSSEGRRGLTLYHLLFLATILVVVQFCASGAWAQTTPPIAGGTPPVAGTPPSGIEAAELNGLLDAINGVQKLGSSPESTGQNAGAIADLLKDIDVGKLGQALESLKNPTNNGTAIPGINGDVNIGALGSAAEALSNGNVSTILQGAFDHIKEQYTSGKMGTADQQDAFRQMQALQEAIKNYGAMKGITTFAKGHVQDVLDKAGLSDTVSALGELLKGGIKDPQDLANRLAKFNSKELNDAMALLGLSGPEALAKFLPPGTDVGMLGKIFDSIKTGNIDGLVDDLVKKLKDDIAKGIGDVLKSQAVVDKLEQIKGDLRSGLGKVMGNLFGGLFKKRNAAGNINAKADCKTLFENMTTTGARDLPADLVYECAQRGIDPPKKMRFLAGEGASANATSNSTVTLSSCKASGVCTNSSLERTKEFAAAYQPQQNENLKLPEIQWEQVTKGNLPCGAIGTLAEMAVQSIWRNVKINLPSGFKQLVNSALSSLLGNLFGKKVDCQEGTFWGAFNNVLGLLIPQLKNNNSGIMYDMSNNTFLAPEGAMLTLPSGSQMEIDLKKGGGNYTLPAGGSFNDANGNTVSVPANGNVQFGADGKVSVNGQQHQVDPNQVITLTPNGLVSIPGGTQIPVTPDASMIPMGPNTTPPDWANPG